MKLVRSVAMYTDHTYYGNPIETSTVSLFIDEAVTPEQLAFLKIQQQRRLESMAKNMPHSYWLDEGKK